MIASTTNDCPLAVNPQTTLVGIKSWWMGLVDRLTSTSIY